MNARRWAVVVLTTVVAGLATACGAVSPAPGRAVVFAGATPKPSPALPDGVTNVTVSVSDQDPRVRLLAFDSAVLGLRAVSSVRLPAAYSENEHPYGTLYHLHGTRGATALGDKVVETIEQATPQPGVGAADSGDASAQTENFLVVSLDAGPQGWCNSCWWVDGKDGHGVRAESHLYQELMPTVEALFNVRRDRGGRAIYGSSMGGIGALIQAFRHPDHFAYVASQSGPASGMEHHDVGQMHQDGLYYGTYLVGQGYPDPVTSPIAYRNIDVVTLAPQVVGTGLEIVLWANDGCLPPYDPQPQPVGDPDCVRTSQLDPNDAFHMANEWGIRTDNEVLAARLVDLGVPFRLETGHGRHGPSRLYPDHVVGDLNRVFATVPTDPQVVSYKTADRAFSVWGYDVEVVERPTEEFVHLLGARTDGREFTLAGTGTVAIRSPAVAAPGHAVEVTLVRENAPDETLDVSADAAGRVHLELILGPAHTTDQRQFPTRQGLVAMPRTRVVIAS